MSLTHPRTVEWWEQQLEHRGAGSQDEFERDRLQTAEVIVLDLINRRKALDRITARLPGHTTTLRDSIGRRIVQLENVVALIGGANIRDLRRYMSPSMQPEQPDEQ